ncbi:MAG TPA: sigma-54 dependent transcriptional regulator [bacterium]|nr:sigma-54 dependent transcriptional regulator [bacterium]HOL47754.1 sigma-54 dependent transcriptional regulator [bacterium]HPQ17706.1 sigma-54 dependent transcriptional regulator [bacterium]
MEILSLLFVDDEENVRNFLVELFKEEYTTYTAASGVEAIEIIRTYLPDIIFLDIIMPGEENGIEILKKIKSLYPNQNVVMLTAVGEIETAVKAIKLGAFDYIEKPFDIERLRNCITKIKKTIELEKEIQILKEEIEEIYPAHNIIGNSDAMKNIFNTIEKIANTDAIVLIEGETGVGKELIARRIHQISKRSNKPFITVDCGVIPDTLFESELFGYEKGAFTGATSRKQGRIELANTGTLFIDEIGNLKYDLQTKFLRVIQEKEFIRLGGTKPIRVDVRILAATNKRLKTLVEKNIFREDLFYRLNVVNIYIPPLRERREDIALLVDYYLKKFCLKNKKKKITFSNELLNYLVSYDWPGNVRELQNFIERIVVLTNKEYISLNDLPEDISKLVKKSFTLTINEFLPLKEFINNAKMKYINYIMTQNNNDIEKTASILEIDKNYLKSLIKGQIENNNE